MLVRKQYGTVLVLRIALFTVIQGRPGRATFAYMYGGRRDKQGCVTVMQGCVTVMQGCVTVMQGCVMVALWFDHSMAVPWKF